MRNEADTRADLIDPQLVAAGWGSNVNPETEIKREFLISPGQVSPGNNNKTRSVADYILIYKNRKLAVIEAKKEELDVSEGVGQAKDYAKKLNLKSAFAANGREIYQISMDTGQEGQVDSFPTPDELWSKIFKQKNEWIESFNNIPFEFSDPRHTIRFYQEIAVNNVMQAIAEDKKRILLTLATGTGKTFIAAQIAWKLFETKWNLQKDKKRSPRILFLVDRNILADQALLAFSSFSNDALTRIDPSDIRKRGGVPKNATIFFTIYQTFMSGKNDQPWFKEYSKDFFDFVIVDECHRGGGNDESAWREILDYFEPAPQLGLTATPKRDDNTDTYEYFGTPVYEYSLKEGIDDGFLTPFKVQSIQTTIDEYTFTGEDTVIEGDPEQGSYYGEDAFNNIIVIKEREKKRVQELIKVINKDDKTIVFCANQKHAALIRDLINQESKNTSPDYCVRVTANDGKIGDTHLKRFQDNEKLLPTILTTSRKLSTGVDARNVRNIVLMRPIKNMIEFKQIIGRGTRLFEGKNYFTIIDFVKAYLKFNDPEWDGPPQEPVTGGTMGGGKVSPEIPPPDDEPPKRPKKIKIKLADGKEREIDSMSSMLLYLNGKVVSPEEFIKQTFDILKLPTFFNDEKELIKIWSNPITRSELLSALTKEGCKTDDLIKIQELINAKDCDLFDVLKYISFAKAPKTRRNRVSESESKIYEFLNHNEKEFISFILQNYIKVGVGELDISNLPIIVQSKYSTITDAESRIGSIEEIKKLFIGFQKHLYLDEAR
ncbi:DEAD/DEAH box helicase family protein [bacterium]|nr:DEAD/DEAH box helicase family protein [bacterium]